MTETISNTLLVQEAQARKTPIKDLAYRTGNSQTMPYRTFRLNHSTPVYRRGVPVAVIPQFKSVTLFTPTAVNGATKGFQTNITGVSIAWPRAMK